MPTSPERFPCTPGGAIAQGQRRLRALLGGLAILMLVMAAAAFAAGRAGAAVLALLVAAGPLLGRGLLRGAVPSGLEVQDRSLVVQTAAGRVEIPLAGATARRLGSEEIAHLGLLASVGGITAGAGSFESHLLGELELYATDLAKAVLITAGERTLVVTPDDPESFLAALAR
jgi:hypothetical protein